MKKIKFTLDHTNMIARQLRYKGNLREFWLGMNYESEHGDVELRTVTKAKNIFLTTKNPRTSIISNDNSLTARATLVRLEEKPHYYSQLLKFEGK